MVEWSGWAVPDWTPGGDGAPHYFETFINGQGETGNTLCGRYTWDARLEEDTLGDALAATPSGFASSPCDECLRVLAERKRDEGQGRVMA